MLAPTNSSEMYLLSTYSQLFDPLGFLISSLITIFSAETQ